MGTKAQPHKAHSWLAQPFLRSRQCVLRIKLTFLSMQYIQHNHCPYRCLLDGDELGVHKTYKTEVHIANTAQQGDLARQ